MSAGALRTLIHLAGIVLAAALFALLPFGPLTNAAIALFVWLVDGAVAEAVFRRRASLAERIADLRDRVDHPPS